MARRDAEQPAETPKGAKHTLRHDSERYLDQKGSQLVSIKDRRRNLYQWMEGFGHIRTLALDEHIGELNAQLYEWRKNLSGATCNHRRDALMNVVRVLYGSRAASGLRDPQTERAPKERAPSSGKANRAWEPVHCRGVRNPDAQNGDNDRLKPGSRDVNNTEQNTQRLARRTRRMSVDEWVDYRRQYKAEHGRDAEPPTLGPSAAFPEQGVSAEMRRNWQYPAPEAETGQHSRAVTHRLLLACSGWKRPPGADEFHHALHAKRRTRRRRSIVAAWLQEASLLEWWNGVFESAYTWRELAEAVHVQGLGYYPQCARLNARTTT